MTDETCSQTARSANAKLFQQEDKPLLTNSPSLEQVLRTYPKLRYHLKTIYQLTVELRQDFEHGTICEGIPNDQGRHRTLPKIDSLEHRSIKMWSSGRGFEDAITYMNRLSHMDEESDGFNQIRSLAFQARESLSTHD